MQKGGLPMWPCDHTYTLFTPQLFIERELSRPLTYSMRVKCFYHSVVNIAFGYISRRKSKREEIREKG